MQHNLFAKYMEQKNNRPSSCKPVARHFYSVCDKENSVCSNLDESTFHTNHSVMSSNKSFQRVSPLEKIMQQGYVKPPTTIPKPFKLSRSNSQQRYSKVEEDPQSKNFKARKVPKIDTKFEVYKSEKALTIPQEPNLYTGRNRSVSRERKRETPEELLQRLRAQAKEQQQKQHIMKREQPNNHFYVLMDQFKRFSHREVNQITEINRKDSLGDLAHHRSFMKVLD